MKRLERNRKKKLEKKVSRTVQTDLREKRIYGSVGEAG